MRDSKGSLPPSVMPPEVRLRVLAVPSLVSCDTFNPAPRNSRLKPYSIESLECPAGSLCPGVAYNILDGLKNVIMFCEQVCTEGTKTSKKHVILTSWASVATALLLVLLVGGALYVADLKSEKNTVRNYVFFSFTMYLNYCVFCKTV